MPDTQISDEMVERAWAKMVGADIAAQCFNVSITRGDLKRGLEDALAGHVVVPIADLTELVRVCNGAEHDAKSVASKLVGHYMQHNVEVLAHTFKLIREKIKDQAAPPVPEMEG